MYLYKAMSCCVSLNTEIRPADRRTRTSHRDVDIYSYLYKCSTACIPDVSGAERKRWEPVNRRKVPHEDGSRVQYGERERRYIFDKSGQEIEKPRREISRGLLLHPASDPWVAVMSDGGPLKPKVVSGALAI